MRAPRMVPSRFFATELVQVPTMGDSISEGTVQEFVKNVGDYVELDEVIVVVETDKVTLDIRSPHAGVITEWKADEGDTVEVGSDFLVIDTDASPPEGGAAPAAEPTPEPATPEPAAEAPKAAEPVKEAPKPAAPPKKAAPVPDAPPRVPGSRNETRQKMSRMRMRIAERLKEA